MTRQYDIQYVNAYVSGSSALAAERTAPRKRAVKLPTPKRAKKTVIAVDPVTIMGIAVAMVLCVMLLVGWMKLDQANRKAEVMEDYVISLRQQNDQLQRTYEAGCDKTQVREIADAMGMVDISQVKHVQVQVQTPPAEKTPTAWESFCTFLAGLFA